MSVFRHAFLILYYNLHSRLYQLNLLKLLFSFTIFFCFTFSFLKNLNFYLDCFFFAKLATNALNNLKSAFCARCSLVMPAQRSTVHRQGYSLRIPLRIFYLFLGAYLLQWNKSYGYQLIVIS